jgi:hypothetical protein
MTACGVIGNTVPMPTTITCSADVTVDRPVEAALALFTAEGERAWAPGWEPTFAAPGRTEGAGAVFVTTHDDQATTWVMVDQDGQTVRYARVTPGVTAGTVAVAVVQSDPTRTRLRVTYDLTALTTDAERWLDHFAAGFVGYIAGWEAAIADSPAGLRQQARGPGDSDRPSADGNPGAAGRHGRPTVD